MTAVQKILVPVDFSAHSQEALRFAIELARGYDASLELLHVFHSPAYALPEGYVVPSAEQLDPIVSELAAQLSAAKRAALDAGAKTVETTLLRGGVASEILRFAEQRACDLIVMGTHGRTGLSHLLIGSVAEHIVRVAPCPVLTVRAVV